MRELLYEEIMTTRVALPNFIIGCRMSEMRRRLLPSPTPEQQSVRRNLFGPIDHEENFKFVQAELAKIAQSDAEKWNFDFTENKPKDGRFKWEAVGTSEVPSAYQLPNLTSVNQSKGTCVVPTFRRVETTPPKESTVPSSSSPASTSAVPVSDEIVDSVALTTTGSTTVVTTTTSRSSSSITSSTAAPTPVPATQAQCSSSNFVKSNKVTVESKNGPKSHLINKPSEKLQQPSIKDMFKIKKRPLNGSSKVDSEEQPPTLVNKRQRT